VGADAAHLQARARVGHLARLLAPFAALLIPGCISNAKPLVLPGTDRGLYQCAEAVANENGFVVQRDTGTSSSRLTVTTRPDIRSRQYDGLAIRILTNAARTRTWLEVRPFSGIVMPVRDDDSLLASPLARSVARTVDRRCNGQPGGLRGVGGGTGSPGTGPREAPDPAAR
jgi:hypothetical protein